MKKLILLMALFSMILVGIVSASIATPTVTTPTATSPLGQDGLINITIPASGGNTNVTSCAVFAKSASTANSSWSLILNITNSTATPTNGSGVTEHMNATFRYNDTSGKHMLEDSGDYQFKATCYNGSNPDDTTGGGVDSATVTGITVDRTKPQAPTHSISAETVYDADVTKTITYTVVGANTTSCRIAFLDNGKAPRFTGTNTFAMTHSGNSCTYTVPKAGVPDGMYDLYAWGYDGTNKTVSSVVNIEIDTTSDDLTGGLDGLTVPVGEMVAKGRVGKEAIFIILAIVLIYAIFFKKTDKK